MRFRLDGRCAREHARSSARRLRARAHYLAAHGRRPRPHPAPVFVFGNQKSGTTVIARLLAKHAGLDVTADLNSHSTLERQWLHDRRMSLERFVRRHSVDFARPIIKEPFLTLYMTELFQLFGIERALFVVRHPCDNIRSILDRCRLPGTIRGPVPSGAVPLAWERILDGSWIARSRRPDASRDVIGVLADRWLMMAEVYEAHAARLVLLRYEDFAGDKAAIIAATAARLGLPARNDITADVERQWQPRGRNRDQTVESFFGTENLRRIERTCARQMAKFGYATTPRSAPACARPRGACP